MSEPNPSNHPYAGPPELRSAFETMISNVDEILSSCEAIHGASYRDVLTSFFGLATSLTQLESLSCDMSQTLGYIAVKNDNEEMKDKASFSHDISHHYAETIHTGSTNIAMALEATGKYPDLRKNIQMIIDRAETDFLSKLHAHITG